MPSRKEDPKEIAAGKFLRLLRRGSWEYVERKQCSGVVAIVAVTGQGRLLLTEQFRAPVQQAVIELPAGLAGDVVAYHGEALEAAAARELMEETGYEATHWERLCGGPVSAGLSNEVIIFFGASGLAKTGEGGGDETEQITVHEVPLDSVESWLAERERSGLAVDPKIFAGLFFARRAQG